MLQYTHGIFNTFETREKSCLCVYIHICIYIYIYICVCLYMCTCHLYTCWLQSNLRVGTYVCMHIHASIQMHVCVYIQKYIHIPICICMCVHTKIHTYSNMYACPCTSVHTWICMYVIVRLHLLRRKLCTNKRAIPNAENLPVFYGTPISCCDILKNIKNCALQILPIFWKTIGNLRRITRHRPGQRILDYEKSWELRPWNSSGHARAR